MLVFPNAKLNLGLHITARRPDGFHTLETAMVPLPWTDALEVLPAPEAAETSLTLTGRPVPGEPATNLCVRAYELLRADFPQVPAVRLHLHKVVPIGAGLGGGSADAAFALRALNTVLALNLSDDALEAYARRLGSDCAFFIRNQPALALGRGDELSALPLPQLAGAACKVIYPNLHISTAEAYAGVTPRPPQHALGTALAAPINTWRDTVVNDFEASLAPKFPVLAQLKEQLYAAGAAYASLSGSGSAVFGLWPGQSAPPKLALKADYEVWDGVL
ncbi:4-(cytidine 5'-diphospho)-2-C-methyl-D-erythritol kinase [Hymenobacter busanensis]|uniref:4-diphosphocytidyl-2-C-methyl-D-erythritol kinase n=1 Tax=Hymenobacter busanensis TaxID=2607656 RepID=A0A7L4ZWU9_9BACT|nr:4-(cytidine 5'-diphospho)-2-C-methyl-D-erythritol kinase [Hymenobacter busanensis]KAA9332199.1 4-(cytidine 5'-diphospho)-2-C-methyl-D-erythritol kinase [Hymenobacter busanensis]QHJ07463.1 4-(cytidine 5'-diphospho)-2-C-methyl-D-erythritol kinase [Hymenobacter busanensis]